MSTTNPTAKTYAALNRAFNFFNGRLFGGELPPCLVTLQQKNNAYGYFAGGRFGSKDGAPLAASFRQAVSRRLSQQGMGRENARDRLVPFRYRPTGWEGDGAIVQPLYC